MGFIIIIPFAALFSWTIFAIARWLRRGNFGAKWRRAFAVLVAVGLVLGIFFATTLHYFVANVRLGGFPIPVNIANREQPGAPWMESVMPLPIRLGGMFADILSGVALCLAPLAAAMFWKEFREKSPPGNPHPTNPP